jgi:ketosteroid isomerase-like protein
MISNLAAAEKTSDVQMFERLFSAWANAFNHKDLKGSCNLFSVNVAADYQGIPTKNHESICNGFKKIFREKRHYEYHFKLHEIYRSHDWASVRITWYLEISQQGKVISKTQDEGLDVLHRNNQGDWKIINYLAYPIH